MVEWSNRWQKVNQSFFIVKAADMNPENGWDSARDAGNGILLWKNR